MIGSKSTYWYPIQIVVFPTLHIITVLEGTDDMETVTLNWKAFKESGKLAYSGTAIVKDKQYHDSSELLHMIDASQSEVRKGSLACRQFHIVVSLPENQKSEFFYERLIPIHHNFS